MPTLLEIESGLPNGFHDARLHSCHVDFVARTASLALDILIGTPESEDSTARERYAAAILLLEGVAFFEVQPPDPTYPFQTSDSLQVDLSEPEANHPLIKTLPKDTFAGRFFVSNWNSFIYVAARQARLEWASKA